MRGARRAAVCPLHRCCTHATHLHCVLQADAELHEEEEEQRYLSCTPLPAPSDVHGLDAFLAAARPDPALCTPAAVLASCQVRMHTCTEYRSKSNTFCLLWLLPSCQVRPRLWRTVVTLKNKQRKATRRLCRLPARPKPWWHELADGPRQMDLDLAAACELAALQPGRAGRDGQLTGAPAAAAALRAGVVAALDGLTAHALQSWAECGTLQVLPRPVPAQCVHVWLSSAASIPGLAWDLFAARCAPRTHLRLQVK